MEIHGSWYFRPNDELAQTIFLKSQNKHLGVEPDYKKLTL